MSAPSILETLGNNLLWGTILSTRNDAAMRVMVGMAGLEPATNRL